ncbi:MAG: trehalose-6-phosphate synthase [Candidatus Acetothermia bacterium]
MDGGQGKMIVVSNAEPYKHESRDDGKTVCKEVEGGLTTAMNPQMRETGGVWIAYGRGDRDADVVNSEGEVSVPDFPDVPEDKRYTLKRLDFSPERYDKFYRGYANRVLWPIFHSFPSKADLEREGEYWAEGYLPCNREYARAVVEVYEPGDTVWVHDYHLALVPKLVKEEIPDAKIGVFWHIPWPPWENFGKVPHRRRILEGLAAADLMGLHLEKYANNLLRCAGGCGARFDLDSNSFKLGKEEIQVEAYPLGVDFKFFNETETDGEELDIRKMYKDKKLVLGVDRQDYTKGIPERIRAFKKFLRKNPTYQEKIAMVQRTPTSRTEISEYQKEKNEINRGVSEFNGNFGNHDWTPISLFWQGIPQKKLIAEYRAADVGLVTPGLDGMNLVSKEFIAANEEPKVLILSEFAGSSEQLDEAIHVNPYDSDQVAGAIKEAIEMPEGEKKERWEELRRKVKTEDLSSWAENFLGDLDRAHRLHSMAEFAPFAQEAGEKQVMRRS